ncbi:MAG: 6-phosphogluconolactonase, partial [Candidatus Berkelbacteria bacterium]|nr:6-phosphogluconolactonase [Candidatus Berkelbacteria bacterium]
MIKVLNLLHDLVDRKTALFLSGGSTPKDLYAKIAKDKKLIPGAVAMVDERYGKRFHKDSNELMIKNTGLISYFEKNNIRFYSILQKDTKREDTALQYDETVSFLLSHFPKSVAILGIGVDGHTAGLPARLDSAKRAGVQSSKFSPRGEAGKVQNERLVI